MGCRQVLHRYGEIVLGVLVASLETAITQADRAHTRSGWTGCGSRRISFARQLWFTNQIVDLLVNCLVKGISNGALGVEPFSSGKSSYRPAYVSLNIMP